MNATVRERRSPVSRRASERRSRSRAPFFALGFLVILAAAAAGAAYVYDHGRSDRIAPGVKIGGVDVGGLTTQAARERLIQRAVAPRRRTLSVHAHGHTFTLPAATSKITADLDPALDRALAESRKGWIGRRVMDGLGHKRVDESLSLPIHYAPGVVAALTERVGEDRASRPGRRERHAERDRPPGQGVQERPRAERGAAQEEPRRGAHLGPPPADDLGDDAPRFAGGLHDRARRQVPGVHHRGPPRPRPALLPAPQGDGVLPDRRRQAGLETPEGLYDVQWKETNPSWHVPNSPWAGDLAGKTIPPGPDDPIKARWMAFNGGAGIHGIDPAEYSSIGHDASHGCVRMRIPDVISLYARTPVHTPVFVT